MKFTLLLLIYGLPALAQEVRTLRVGEYQFDTIEDKQSLKIHITNKSPNIYPDYSKWFDIRFNGEGDRMGLREYWNTPLRETEIFHELDLVLSPSLNSDWSKIYQVTTPHAYLGLLSLIEPHYLKNKAAYAPLKQKIAGLDFYSINMGLDPMADRTLAKKFFAEYQLGKYKGPFEKKRYQTEVPNKPTLIVTHASAVFNFDRSIKKKADQLVASFKSQDLPVVYLIHDDKLEDYSWFLKDRNPDIALFSHGGEHSLLIKNPEVTMIGGYFDQCFRRSVQDTITRFYLTHDENQALHIHLPMAGIYYADETLQEAYSQRPKEFLGLVKDALFWKIIDWSDDSNDPGNEAIGELNISDYTFNISINGLLLKTLGSGKKTVELLFET